MWLVIDVTLCQYEPVNCQLKGKLNVVQQAAVNTKQILSRPDLGISIIEASPGSGIWNTKGCRLDSWKKTEMDGCQCDVLTQKTCIYGWKNIASYLATETDVPTWKPKIGIAPNPQSAYGHMGWWVLIYWLIYWVICCVACRRNVQIGRAGNCEAHWINWISLLVYHVVMVCDWNTLYLKSPWRIQQQLLLADLTSA